MNIRTFITLEISDVIRNQITQVQRKLMNKGAEVKWSPKENIHLTLKFLGDIDEKNHDMIFEAMENVGRKARRLKLSLTELGMFPSVNHPSTLWVGLDGEIEKLRQLAEKCDYYFNSIGYESEKKYFKPHLTIGRIKKLTNKKQFISEVINIHINPTEFEVEKLHLVKSDLQRTGAIYTILHTIHFNN